MTVKRRDFQKAAALIHEFLLKLPEEPECAELRDSLNLALLHMQRYYRRLRSRMQTLDKQNNGNHILTQSLRGLSPMTPFRDTPDKFQWKWINLDNPKLANTLPTDYNKEFSNLPPIILTAKIGDNNLLMQHIEQDPDCVFEVDGIGRTALMYAVNFGHLDTVQILLENGIDVNATAHDASTAVHRACHEGNHEVLQILMEYDADLQVKDSQGRYPIHWACAHKKRDCLQVLMEDQRHNIDTTVRDNDGMTPSMWACRMDNIEHFELLSSVQISVEEDDGFERDNNGKTWMHWSVRRTEPLECLKTLLTEDSAAIKDEEGKTVIHTAAEMGSLAAVKIIMEIAGKEVLEHRDGQNHTPLILATIGGHGEVVNHLLAEGADLMAVDDTGATAWDYACKRQLHYCMLILASYIRQRAREEEEGIEAGQGESYNAANSMADGTLGLDHLQINGQNGDFPVLQGHRPTPPPHPPTEPLTPRTPRVPRPKTPHGNQQHEKFAGGVKRSPSTPDANEEEAFFEYNHNKPSSANSSKRLKNEHSPDRETLMSVMSVESPDRRSTTPHTHSATHSSIRTEHGQHDDADEEPEMANDSQYVDGADDEHSRVSIDAMDVSDFEADAEDEGADEGQDHHRSSHTGSQQHNAQYPQASPRPPPQPYPRHQQSPAPPYSHAPSHSASRSPPPYQRNKGLPTHTSHKSNTYHSQQHDSIDEPPPSAYIESQENGYDDQDDPDPGALSTHDEDRAHQIHFPTENIPTISNDPNHLEDGVFDFEADLSEETKRLLLCDESAQTPMCVTPSTGVQLRRNIEDSEKHCCTGKKNVHLGNATAVNTCNKDAQAQFHMKQDLTPNQSSLESLPKVRPHGEKLAVGMVSSGNPETDKTRVKHLDIKSPVKQLPVRGTTVLTTDKILLSHPDKNKLMNVGMEPIQAASKTRKIEVARFLTDVHGMPSKGQSFPAQDGMSEGRSVEDRMLPTSETLKRQAVEGGINMSTAAQVTKTECSEFVERSKVLAVTCAAASQQNDGTRFVPKVSSVQLSTSTGQQQRAGIIIQSSTPPAETRVIPPAHLSPLHNNMPVAPRKKKKKKKKSEKISSGDDAPPARGYVAAIPPPLHQPPVTHAPLAGPQRVVAARGGMVGGAGNVRPSSGSLRPMPKKRQSTMVTSDEEHSLSSQTKTSKLSGQLSNAPQIAPKGPPPRPSSTSLHVPPLPQAQPRPQSSAPSHPKKSDTETLPDNRRILRHPDGNHGSYEGDESDEYEERAPGHLGSSKRFQNMKQNGTVTGDVRGQQQNGSVQWPQTHNRRDPSPAPRDKKHPPSPRGRRPPSGSLGGLSQQVQHRPKHQLANGRLP